MKEKLKKNRGITLIALIITIIVMIILVAVTVNIANENGGLFVRTRQAKVDTAYRAEQENLLMYMYGEDYDAATGKLNLAGVQAKLVNDNNTSNRWESITLNAALTELTVVGTQSGKTHTILSNGTLDGEDNPTPEPGIYEGKVWGKTVTDEKLKGLGYTDEEIATERTDKKVYFINVFSQYIDRFGNAKNKEEADSIIAEIIQIEGKAGSKSDTGEWIDITEPNEFEQAYSFGIKNSNFWWDALLSDTIVATWKVTEQTETKISCETTKEETDKNGNTTTKTVNYPVFIGDNGNSIYFIMFGT